MNSKNTMHLIKRIVLGTTFALSLILTTSAAANGAPRARPDFNRDGFADLVIGVPDEDIGVHENTGAVHVIYGTAAGPNAVVRNQFLTMGEISWPADGNGSALGSGTRFGSVLAWGDFNGDGFDDLAIGIPDYNAPYQPCGMPQTGLVYILKGSIIGLVRNETQYLVSTNVDGPFLNVNQDQGDRFGAALAAGNFNGDFSPTGFPIDDLAIGTPGEDGWDGVASIPNAGDVYVLYGKSFHMGDWKPLEQHNAEGWSQNGKTFWPDIEDDPQANDEFGAALAAGDFNGDGNADLAIGVPGEAGARGAVNVIYGSPTGLENVANQLWVQQAPGVREAGELFGFSLVAGNFNGDNAFGRQIDDLAIGAPKATVAGEPVAGEVTVIHGSVVGLAGPGFQLWSQMAPGIGDNGLFAGDQFGFSLAAANFNGDAFADLAIGVPFDSPGGVGSAGAVNVIYGSAFGLNAFAQLASQYFFQPVSPTNFNDQFGRYLAVGDFNGNGIGDLAVGVPNDRAGGGGTAGAMNLVYGSPAGLNLAGIQPWHQNSPGVPDSCESQDGFGVAATK